MTPWKFCDGGRERRTRPMLQFGHGYDTVEIGSNGPARSAHRPLQFGHGYDTVEIPLYLRFILPPSSRFNSATAMTPWKCTWPGRGSTSGFRFNSATAMTPWKCRTPRARAACPPRRFNSATAMTPWKWGLPPGSGPHKNDCFNSATAMTPWKSIGFLLG